MNNLKGIIFPLLGVLLVVAIILIVFIIIKKKKGKKISNENNDIPNQPITNTDGVNFQNPTINVNDNTMNNNSNTETQPMFNQNINTEINQIPNINMENNNLNASVNPIPQPEMNQTPVFNPTAPLANPQPEVNVVSNQETPLQPVDNTPINSMDNQVNSMQGVVPSQENTFKYEIPTPVVEAPVAAPQPEPITQNGFVTGNQNVQPVTEQPQINVIPGMGITPQPEVPNQNNGNNQPM